MWRVVRGLALGALLCLAVVTLWTAWWLGPMLYRSFVGLKRFETVAPALPARLGDRAILIFSKTNGFRDDAQIAAANAALAGIARRQGWTTFVTENGAVFQPDLLRRFRAVVWNSVSGDVLTTDQRAAFRSWLEAGGGFVGLHGAGGDPHYAWRWYVDSLIGAQFIGHTLGPQIQQATLRIKGPTHPATRGLGPVWVRSDEWYSFAASPRRDGYHVLVSIDERSYRPVEALLPFVKPKVIAMGVDHPLIWWHCVGRGRALYSALGHRPEAYAEPAYLHVITGAIDWAAGFSGPSCGPAPAAYPPATNVPNKEPTR